MYPPLVCQLLGLQYLCWNTVGPIIQDTSGQWKRSDTRISDSSELLGLTWHDHGKNCRSINISWKNKHTMMSVKHFFSTSLSGSPGLQLMDPSHHRRRSLLGSVKTVHLYHDNLQTCIIGHWENKCRYISDRNQSKGFLMSRNGNQLNKSIVSRRTWNSKAILSWLMALVLRGPILK